MSKAINPKALEMLGLEEKDFTTAETPPMQEIEELRQANAELREALEALLRGGQE